MKPFLVTTTFIFLCNTFSAITTHDLVPTVNFENRKYLYKGTIKDKTEEGNNVLLHDKSMDDSFVNNEKNQVLYTPGQIVEAEYISYYQLPKQQHLKKSRHKDKHRNRRRHNHRQFNDANESTFGHIEYSEDEQFGYLDTNNHRVIRQAARLTTKENSASTMDTLPRNTQIPPTNMLVLRPLEPTNILLPSVTSNYIWPKKRSVDLEGHVLIGGMHMVHERNDANTCGPIMPQGGIQAVETMLHAIDYVNDEMSARGEWIKNVTLGTHILDDCDTDTYGLEMAVDFIKGNDQSLLLCAVTKIYCA